MNNNGACHANALLQVVSPFVDPVSRGKVKFVSGAAARAELLEVRRRSGDGGLAELGEGCCAGRELSCAELGQSRVGTPMPGPTTACCWLGLLPWECINSLITSRCPPLHHTRVQALGADAVPTEYGGAVEAMPVEATVAQTRAAQAALRAKPEANGAAVAVTAEPAQAANGAAAAAEEEEEAALPEPPQ